MLVFCWIYKKKKKKIQSLHQTEMLIFIGLLAIFNECHCRTIYVVNLLMTEISFTSEELNCVELQKTVLTA